MHLNREQISAMKKVRQIGYFPVNAIVLTSKSKTFGGLAVVSVSACKDKTRYNIRVGVNARNPGLEEPVIISCDSLKTIIDIDGSENIHDINGCLVQTVIRTPVSISNQ